MTGWLLSFALSWFGVGLAAAVFAAAAVLAFLRGWTHIAIVLGGLAVVAIYSGYIADLARENCEARVAAEVDAERERQRAVAADALAELNRELDALSEEKTAAEQSLAEFEVEIAARADPACELSPEDADAIDQ